ncbi:MAG: DUF2007 domain-containing protein [Verrucomicrobiota bacterium]
MHEVFRDIDSAKVGMIDGLLQESGISTLLKNFTGGSNITEIPIPALYPTVYVLDPAKLEEANHLIQEFFNAKPIESDDWYCDSCGETVDGFLIECWSCQQQKYQNDQPNGETR